MSPSTRPVVSGPNRQPRSLEALEAGREEQRAQCLAGGEVGLFRYGRELVPRAAELAVVAAVDAIADGRPQRFRYRPRVLDGEIRDAQPRVELRPAVEAHEGEERAYDL